MKKKSKCVTKFLEITILFRIPIHPLKCLPLVSLTDILSQSTKDHETFDWVLKKTHSRQLTYAVTQGLCPSHLVLKLIDSECFVAIVEHEQPP